MPRTPSTHPVECKIIQNKSLRVLKTDSTPGIIIKTNSRPPSSSYPSTQVSTFLFNAVHPSQKPTQACLQSRYALSSLVSARLPGVVVVRTGNILRTWTCRRCCGIGIGSFAGRLLGTGRRIRSWVCWRDVSGRWVELRAQGGKRTHLSNLLLFSLFQGSLVSLGSSGGVSEDVMVAVVMVLS